MTTLPLAAALALLVLRSPEHTEPPTDQSALVPPRQHPLYDEAIDGLDAKALPEEQKPRYALFAEKCKRCHSLGRSLVSGKRPEEWRKYAKRMIKMAGKGLSEDEAYEIIDFLEFYSSWPPRK
jgi:hypothetical protein